MELFIQLDEFGAVQWWSAREVYELAVELSPNHLVTMMAVRQWLLRRNRAKFFEKVQRLSDHNHFINYYRPLPKLKREYLLFEPEPVNADTIIYPQPRRSND